MKVLLVIKYSQAPAAPRLEIAIHWISENNLSRFIYWIKINKLDCDVRPLNTRSLENNKVIIYNYPLKWRWL